MVKDVVKRKDEKTVRKEERMVMEGGGRWKMVKEGKGWKEGRKEGR